MANIRFEWDETKNLANQRKHGVSFRQASQVFNDPQYVSIPDRVVDGEQRWQTFGVIEAMLLLMVGHTAVDDSEKDAAVDAVRIITARRATRRERRLYESEDR